MNKKPLPKNQTSIESLFGKPTQNPQSQLAQTQDLLSEIPEVQAFYKSLNKAEQVAHSIAKEKLGTSYDVRRTHGYIKWKKSMPL